MPLPNGLLVSRYRAFAGEEILPLRPLTLLYGRNNSGKSAIARAFALLGATIDDDAGAALALPPDVVHDGSFTDIAWQGEAGDYTFDLGFRWGEGGVRSARYTFDGSVGRAPYIKELVLTGEGAGMLWNGSAPPYRPMRSSSGGEVEFVGLTPQQTDAGPLQTLAEHLAELRGRIRWLDGVRARPRRTVNKTGLVPSRLDRNGGNAASFLVETPELIEKVGAFYKALTPARELEIAEVLDLGHRIRLSPATRSGFSVELMDTGEGMAQVLPVLVAAELAARDKALLAIEEPESHLHPDAQNVLAGYLARIAAQDDPPTIVVETHSRAFLLGIQIAVASKALPAEKVQLAWIDQDAANKSTIEPVTLSQSGRPMAGWPVSALTEDFRLAAELARFSATEDAV